MIRLARERSAKFLEYRLPARRRTRHVFSSSGLRLYCQIATLHHLPLAEMLLKMKAALKPGGVLLILDLFEPEGATDARIEPAGFARERGIAADTSWPLTAAAR